MKFDKSETPYFEPNANTEERNRAGAYTDCLLQYKEAAKYIAFFDLDDILFPVKHSTYLSEFNAEWKLQPNASAVYYMRKEHEFAKTEYLSEFSFNDIVSSLKSSNTLKPGKFVLRPGQNNFTWIHANLEEQSVKSQIVGGAIIIHIVQKFDENSQSKTWKIDFVESKEKKKIRQKDLKIIDSDISKIRESEIIKKIAQDLPSTDYFVSIVSQCYYDALHPKKRKRSRKRRVVRI
uniref:Glycosyltransferase family 92 protein n=1 Tax=Caenorhabditis tropicalis TaxID=1561998 RepID=A0A1I7TW29_9PELO